MRKSRLSVIALAALAAVVGCSPAKPSETAPTSPSAASEVQVLALAKELADCVRANGLPGFPDPYFENGELKLPPVDANVEQQGQEIIEGPCRDTWQRLEAALPEQQQDAAPSKEQPGPMSAEDLESLKQWTECARRNGFPNWPDPDENGQYHLGSVGLPAGLGKGDRPEDATFRNVLERCQEFAVQGMGFTN